MKISSEEFLLRLQENPNLKIAVCNFGENLGMDLAYFCHYFVLKEQFPDITLDLFRSNVDESNCIGQDTWPGKVRLPLNDYILLSVKQRYPNGMDWVQKLSNKDFSIFPSGLIDRLHQYDILWAIGMASSEAWLSNFSTMACIESPDVYNLLRKTNPFTTITNLDVPKEYRPWPRTAMEYACYDKPGYPFAFTQEFSSKMLAIADWSKYMRVSLRWPEYMRWYYTIDRQYKVLFDIISGIKASGKPVNIIYNLKNGEIGNCFNRGQTLDRLQAINQICDSCIFTYSATQNPYFHRRTEEQELETLRQIGINPLKIGFWEDLYICSTVKVYFSEHGGLAEVVPILRKDPDTSLVWPTSYEHAAVHLTCNSDGIPFRKKSNDLTYKQSYDREAFILEADNIGPRRVDHWRISFKGKDHIIGDKCNGDDWKYFDAAQDTVFKEMYEYTRHDLVKEIVSQYIKD